MGILVEKQLFGTCDLELRNQIHHNTPCALLLDEQKFACQIPYTESGLRVELETSVKISNVKLISPAGILTASSLPHSFIAQTAYGPISVAQTEATDILGMKARAGFLKFVINGELEFELPEVVKKPEAIFFPGYDIAGKVGTAAGGFITGAKEHISYHGCSEGELQQIQTALSIAVGSPLRRVAFLKKQSIRLILNHFAPGNSARPMFHSGWPYQDIEKSRKNLAAVFDHAVDYLNKQPIEKRAGFNNAVVSFLEGRVLSSSFELKLLAAFHFLEWFDDSKTLSANQLMKRLGILREEADGICDIRNALVHNNKDLRVAVTEGFKKICSANSDRTNDLPALEPTGAFMNYFYSLLGDRLLAEIGYSGETQAYFPYR